MLLSNKNIFTAKHYTDVGTADKQRQSDSRLLNTVRVHRMYF